MRTHIYQTLLIWACYFCWNSPLFAQSTNYPVAITRQLFHDQVDKAQQQLLAMDGKADAELTWGKNDSLSKLLTLSVTKEVDSLQMQIETDRTASNNQKVTYLRGLAETINDCYVALSKKQLRISVLPSLIIAWQHAYSLDRKQASLSSLMDSSRYVVGKMLLDGISFTNNPFFNEARQHNRLRLAYEKPSQAMYVLSFMPEASFADSLIRVAVRSNPSSVYTYAQAEDSDLGRRIRQMEDSSIQLLCKLAANKNGQLFLPFYDDLLSGNISMPQIEATLGESLAYYKLLVKTAIGYAARVRNGDTIAADKQMRDMLHSKAMQPYVNTINGLHNAGEGTRFKILSGMSPQDLYYLVVNSEQEIYTSSYMYVYRTIWQRMAVPRADTLLEKIQYDHYKKFITMAANYNTLDDFLERMNAANSTTLMTRFVSNLDAGDEDDLEDAVDVANSYASIRNDSLRQMLLERIRMNRIAANETGKVRAATIYRLEDIILSSSETGSHISLPDSLGIPPIFEMPNRKLLTDTGHVVVQVFFYDDFAVAGMFNGFLRSFNPKLWRISGNQQWVMIKSLVGNPVMIFANRANTKEDGTDERNQRALNAYLKRSNLHPTVTIHRGHSYTTRSTIEQMSPQSKIVFLGSCGGYHLINDVLTIAPEAHIIASKQIGRTVINRPFSQLLAEKLRTGENIQWISFWKQLSKVAAYDGFEDYIPPHKNLGAILIKAYHNAAYSAW